jgi:AcrR family transcriptional regulator
MSTKDRRQRERAEREQRFLDKAQELIQRDGLLPLQMSRIAEECDYAIGTLYQHFESKEDLLVTLATRNCLSRVDLFERAARWSGPTRERMLAIALADLMVIRAQPEHFRLAQFVWTDVIWEPVHRWVFLSTVLSRTRSPRATCAPISACRRRLWPSALGCCRLGCIPLRTLKVCSKRMRLATRTDC